MADNEVIIEIEGNNLTDFINGSVDIKFDQFCNSFSFTTTKDLGKEYNIFPEDECRIIINGKVAMTGIIDTVSPNEDPNSSTVDITGRDKTRDVVDSDLPEGISLSGNFTLVTVIQKVLTALGLENDIKVVNELGNELRSFTQADIVSAEVDKNAFEFINEYAQKVSAILITNAEGNIVITRAGKDSYPDKLVNILGEGSEDNNIISSSAGYDYSQRFYKYIVYSQSNANTSTQNVSISNVAQKGYAIDDEIRASRVMVKKANNACSSAVCTEIATLEANIRRANSLQYSCDVYGYETNDGNLWQINHLIEVYDEDCDIASELMIKGISFSLGEGAVTTLKFALADAYTLQASLDEVDGRTNKTKKSKTKKKRKGKKKKEDKTLTDAEINKILGF